MSEETKKCCRCGLYLAPEHYSKCSARGDGLQNYCKICSKVKVAEWQKANASKYKNLLRDWRANNIEKVRIASNLRSARWRSRNLEYSAVKNAVRRLRERRNSFPLTAKQKLEIREIYKAAKWISKVTGIPYHVDHIHPLAGENFSGLHVPWNLQIITAEENRRKGNSGPAVASYLPTVL